MAREILFDLGKMITDRLPYKFGIKKLTEEDPAYGGIELVWIEEREHPELADKRDYYRVPTLYRGEEKLYEADPSHGFGEIRENIKRAFDRVLGR